jgi:DNA-directed RNA polymerase subunit omega
MVMPLDELISDGSNAYALTCASIRRAAQITLAGDDEVLENDGKVVSIALKQVLTKKVEYRLEDQS